MKYIEITGYHTFGVKKFKCICKDDRIILYNVFGFGLWIYPNRNEYKYMKNIRRTQKWEKEQAK